MVSFNFPQVGKVAVEVTPEPLTVTTAGELLALLLTEILPAVLPVVVGANVTSTAALCPGASIVLELTPLALKPAPEAVTLEIVTLEFPLFVRVTGNVLLLPSFTFPKLKLVGFAPSE